jgi:hypothetical protein
MILAIGFPVISRCIQIINNWPMMDFAPYNRPHIQAVGHSSFLVSTFYQNNLVHYENHYDNLNFKY